MNDKLYAIGLQQVKSYRSIQSLILSAVKQYGLDAVAEWFILAHMYCNTNVRAIELSALLDVEPPLISNLLDNLEKSKLIIKRPDKNDKRNKYLVITKKGQKLVPQLDKVIEGILHQLLYGLSETELLTYKKVLHTIIDNSLTVKVRT